jgi:hypothetical protein
MRITPTQIHPGTIVVKGEVPSLFVGRQVVATVLSMPHNGLVLVSMFGRRFLVETNLDLQKDQVLNLRVHATSPKVIMKPMELSSESKAVLKAIDSMVEQVLGKFGTSPIQAFDVREIIKKLLFESPLDAATMQLVQKLIEDFSQVPTAVAFLVIPFVDEESRGRARVAIERDGEDYRINFQMETDTLGLIESTVFRSARGLAVELRSGSDEVVEFLQYHQKELFDSLDPFGVSTIEIIQRKPRAPQNTGVNMVV